MTRIEMLDLPCQACHNRRDYWTSRRTAVREWFGDVPPAEIIAPDRVCGINLCQTCYDRIRRAARRDAARLAAYAAEGVV